MGQNTLTRPCCRLNNFFWRPRFSLWTVPESWFCLPNLGSLPGVHVKRGPQLDLSTHLTQHSVCLSRLSPRMPLPIPGPLSSNQLYTIPGLYLLAPHPLLSGAWGRCSGHVSVPAPRGRIHVSWGLGYSVAAADEPWVVPALSHPTVMFVTVCWGGGNREYYASRSRRPGSFQIRLLACTEHFSTSYVLHNSVEGQVALPRALWNFLCWTWLRWICTCLSFVFCRSCRTAELVSQVSQTVRGGWGAKSGSPRAAST